MNYTGKIVKNDLSPEEQRELVTMDKPKIIVEHRTRSIGYKLHKHTFFELELYINGEGTNEINGIKTEITDGSVYLYNETDFHKLTLTNGSEAEIYYIGFTWDIVDNKSFIYDNLTQATPIAVKLTPNSLEYQRLLDMFKIMLMDYDADLPYREKFLMNSLENIIITILRLQKNEVFKSTKNNNIAKQALIYIQKNFRNDISLNSIAKELHTSPNYLSSTFHKSYSKTVVSYINDMRLNYASNALKLDSSFSVTDICFECGYKTYSHFLKDFNKKFGTSPKKYQHSHS